MNNVHNLNFTNNKTVSYIFLGWMGSKLAGKNVQDFFSHPSTFCEGGEGEVIRVNFPKT